MGGIYFGQSSNPMAAGAIVRANYKYTAGRDLEFLTSTGNSSSPEQHMVIKGDGKVGIGTDAPSSPLDVINDSTTDGIQLKDAGGGMIARLGADGSNNARARFFNSAHNIVAEINGNAGSATYFNAGDVGIGTTAPEGKLQIDTPDHNTFALRIGNDSYVGGHPYNELLMLNNGSLTWYLPDDGSTPAKFQFYSRDNTEFFFTADSDTSRVGIGNSSSPSYTLDVNSSTTDQVARFKSTDADAFISIEDNYDSVYIGHNSGNNVMSLGF